MNGRHRMEESAGQDGPCLADYGQPGAGVVSSARATALTLTDELNAAEVRKLSEAVGTAVSRSPFGISPYELAPRLKPVDRICQRWAVSIGAGFTNDEWDLPLKSRPTPLDEETAIVVDTIVMKKIPSSTRRLLQKWYRTDIPVGVIADEMIQEYHGRKRPKLTRFLFHKGVVEDLKANLQMTENGVILCWNMSLDLLLERFGESRHLELVRLLTVRW